MENPVDLLCGCTRSSRFSVRRSRGENIGLEKVGDGISNIVYYRTLLGKIDERSLMITGV